MNSKVIRFLFIMLSAFSINASGIDKKSNQPTKPIKTMDKNMMDQNTEKSALKIAYVNLNRVMTFDPGLLPSSSQEWQKNYALLQETLSPIEVELKALEDKFEKGRVEFESLQKSGLVSNEALQQKYEEVAKTELELRRRFQEREQFAQEEVKKIHLKMAPNIEKVIQEIREKHGYTMVLRSEFVIDADKNLDITSEVLSLMDKQYMQEAKPAVKADNK